MADGTRKPIEDVKIGDVVVGTGDGNWGTGPHKVTALIRHTGPHMMVDVTVAGGAILHATDQHPFWDATAGKYEAAVDLRTGDLLREPGGQLVRVSATRIYEQDLTAYNLTVDDVHTYYVLAGDDPVLVHNCPDGVEEVWHIGGSSTLEQAFDQHWVKHAAGRTPAQYLQDAKDWAASVKNSKVGYNQWSVTLGNGDKGLKLVNATTGMGGFISTDGKVVSFWYDATDGIPATPDS
jgi:hypothetical protein